jgi:multidrug transporter EmrE-like cation transporter
MNSYFFFIPLILLTVVLNTLAQTLLKLGAGQNILNIYLLGGLFAYGLSTVFYILVLSKLNLSLTYPIVIGLTVVATTFSGAIFLKEQVPSIQWLGIGLMLSGICAIAFGKSY